MSSWKAKWIALIVSLAVGFRLRSTSALSHHLAPLPGTSNALSLALYVKSSEECALAPTAAHVYVSVLASRHGPCLKPPQDAYEPISLELK